MIGTAWAMANMQAAIQAHQIRASFQRSVTEDSGLAQESQSNGYSLIWLAKIKEILWAKLKWARSPG